MMQARKIKYDVIGLIETRRHHSLHAAYGSGEELFLGTCDSRGVGGVDVLVNTHLAMNIDSYETLTTRRLRLKRCGSVPALTAFVAYAPTSDYDDDEKAADAIRQAAKLELGIAKPGRRKVDKQAWLWTDDVKVKVREKKSLYHVFLGEKTADN
ncbi:unnamed protein product [Heligmosomoides polygyrus]|uniref:tRNA-synt_1c domain-containing protein n=1 Tax=Heligmosomoides polygyrus TaxID=6339 RepID=A0A183FJ41_HELPZ|nr:unnamed protein product [Heligmosomoides polygyrus]